MKRQERMMKNRESASLSRQRKKEVIKIHHYWFSQLRMYYESVQTLLAYVF